MSDSNLGIPEAARMNFDVWDADAEDAIDPKELKDKAMQAINALQFALAINQKSKAEIVQLIDEMPDDLGKSLLDQIDYSCDAFEACKLICEGARARLFVSGAAFVQKSEGVSQ